MLANDERMAAMVSRSADGDLLVPSLRVRHVEAVRGSTRKAGRDKGGRTALATLGERLAAGTPALLAIDGPRGPRGHVRIGVADLARSTGAVVLPVVAVASRRWVLHRTWDRFQIPKPFSRLRVVFSAPLEPSLFASADELRMRVEEELRKLEATYDPAEIKAVNGNPNDADSPRAAEPQPAQPGRR